MTWAEILAKLTLCLIGLSLYAAVGYAMWRGKKDTTPTHKEAV